MRPPSRSPPTGPVIDVQTHLVDPARWRGEGAAALTGFLQLVDPDRWPDAVDPRLLDAAAWAAHVFGESETAIALLTSTPGWRRPQRAARTRRSPRPARSSTGTPGVAASAPTRSCTPTSARRSSTRWSTTTPRSGRRDGSATRCTGRRPTRRRREAGSSTTTRSGFRSSNACDASGTRVVAVHKGLGGPVPSASVAAASPRDIGPAAARVPRRQFPRVPLGLRTRSGGEEGAFDPIAPHGVDRLVASLADAGIAPGANVYAELGSTWYLMLRRPVEAAHVLGKLLLAVGPGSHRVGHRFDLVRLAATAHRCVPHLPDTRAHAGGVRLSRAHRRHDGEDPRRERAVGLRHRRRRRRRGLPPTRRAAGSTRSRRRSPPSHRTAGRP